MSASIKYAYLKGRTWLYRRNYPQDVALALGAQALKQSLKTGDPSVARVRAAELNAHYEKLVSQARSATTRILEGATEQPPGDASDPRWSRPSADAIRHLRATLAGSEGLQFGRGRQQPRVLIRDIGNLYLNKRSNQLRPGGFKSVRYSVGLFLSKYGKQSVSELTRDHGREFLELTSQLSPVIGKSEKTRGLTLDQLVRFSSEGPHRITARTHRRIWSQVNHFLDWLVYEGQLEANPFKSVRFDRKVKPAPYAVPTNDDVALLLREEDPVLQPLLLTCFLTGMRAGEAVGLLREDVVNKGTAGVFLHVRPNHVRLLKTDAAERQVPLHPELTSVFAALPTTGRLFPDLNVNVVTKRFTRLRDWLALEGLVFHSTRKWFITQCERTGVPEHWTASLVGHQSARSENGITYGIYSAGISDEQKRSIVDQIMLPL